MIATILRRGLYNPSTLCRNVVATRNLHVHEYISMDLMNKHNIVTPKSYVASSPDEVENIFSSKMNTPGEPIKSVTLKAQVLSGGRGLGKFKNGFQGGVHMVNTGEEAKDYASKMLGQQLITKQAINGILCNKVLLMETLDIEKEMYLSILMDRHSGGPVIVGSPCGGTSIEDVAKTNPELIFKEEIDVTVGITKSICDRMARKIGIDPETHTFSKATKLFTNLYDMFRDCDCSQVEINPLVQTPSGNILVCDAKVNFDDNAQFRQKDIFSKRDISQEDSREVDASNYDLNYIGLDGTIGCMVNGAGLAMSTMDMIKLKGGSPANFLDVGGGATEQQVEKAFEILNGDSHVKTILVNIFGGIMKCDIIASGIIKAAESINLKKPLVIRLEGTNAVEARKLIAGSGIGVTIASDLEDAAEKAVSFV